MATVSVRPYDHADYAACLAIFDSNVPVYFSDEERPDFIWFLKDMACPYLTVELGERIVGCGGYALEDGRLCWGMIDSAFHGRGLGEYLLLVRIKHMYEDAGARAISLCTSQHTYRFFERVGFTVQQVITNGFAEGLDNYEMQLQMDSERYRSICRRLEEISTRPVS